MLTIKIEKSRMWSSVDELNVELIAEPRLLQKY